VDDAARFAYHGAMIGFLLKKTFYDAWDNMLRLVLLNLGFIVSVPIPILLPGLIPITAVSMLVAVLGIIWCFVYLSAAALSLKAVSDYGSFGFSDFFANIKAGWKAGAAMGVFALFFFPVPYAFPAAYAAEAAAYAVPAEESLRLVPLVGVIMLFYLNMESIWGFLLAAVIFWAFFLALVSFQFFFAIRARLDTKLKKIFKKCFIIFFDNPGFAFFCFLHTVATMALSVFLALLLPGPAGALLFLDEALRLRLLKYDWLEANPPEGPSVRRRAIPWDAILIEEREKTGTRTIKGFIFPWKD